MKKKINPQDISVTAIQKFNQLALCLIRKVTKGTFSMREKNHIKVLTSPSLSQTQNHIKHRISTILNMCIHLLYKIKNGIKNITDSHTVFFPFRHLERAGENKNQQQKMDLGES